MGRRRVERNDFKKNQLVLKLKEVGYYPDNLGIIGKTNDVEDTIKEVKRKESVLGFI